MQAMCKSHATYAHNLGQGGGGGRGPHPKLCEIVTLHVYFVCMFCICFTFYLHLCCITAGSAVAAAAAVAAAGAAVDDAILYYIMIYYNILL